jgi:hypothetical protein
MRVVPPFHKTEDGKFGLTMRFEEIAVTDIISPL